jgi:hypothetical protein
MYSHPGYMYTTDSIFLRIRMKQFNSIILNDLIPYGLIRPSKKSHKEKIPPLDLRYFWDFACIY